MIIQKLKIIMVILLMAIIVFAFTLYQENKEYERYLSLEVRRTLSDIVNATILCNNLYKEIEQTGMITYEQFQSLQYNFERLVPSAYRLTSIAQLYNDNVPMGFITPNLEMAMYINQEFDFAKGNLISLTEDQTMNIRRSEVITGLFIEEMKKGIKEVHIQERAGDINYGGDTMVKDKDWQELLWALDEAIEKYDANIQTIVNETDRTTSGSSNEYCEEPSEADFIIYPSGPDFIKSIIHERGSVKITDEMRELFNLFARDYRWFYLPDMNYYESFFEANDYAKSFGYTNFGFAVAYVLSYMRFPEKMSDEVMEYAIRYLFVNEDRDDHGVNYKDMPHQEYPKLANYEDGY